MIHHEFIAEFASVLGVRHLLVHQAVKNVFNVSFQIISKSVVSKFFKLLFLNVLCCELVFSFLILVFDIFFCE